MKVRATLTFEYTIIPDDYDVDEGKYPTLDQIRDYDEDYILSGEALEFNNVTFTLEEVNED